MFLNFYDYGYAISMVLFGFWNILTGYLVRGALYALHKEMKNRAVAEVVASSTGNHGAAVACAGRLLNA